MWLSLLSILIYYVYYLCSYFLFTPRTCARGISNCFVSLSVCRHKNSLNWSFRQLREFYLALIYQKWQKKPDLTWLRIEQHWPRELQNGCFCRVCAAHAHQTTPTVDHVLFAHAHRYYNLPSTNVYISDVCSWCIDQQTRGVCAL